MPTNVATGRTSQRELLSAEEFLDWLQPGVFADLIDGEKYMHSPVHIKHATLVDFVRTLMRLHVESRDAGLVLGEVWAVRLGSRSVFMPDICWFDREQARNLQPNHAPFAPRLAVECLSPSTSERDVGRKFAAYEEHGLDEYWILDPHDLEHRFYSRSGDLLVEFGRGEETIVSRRLQGFHLARAWLDPDHLPPILPCFHQL